MRISLLLLLAVCCVEAQTWRVAQPGFRFEFPRDHFAHPEFQTEWWYFTGNLRANDGHRFGYELTFFRQAQTSEPQAEVAAAWRTDRIYLAHLALSDLDGQEFFHTERLNRPGPGLAGAALHDSRYWNGNWEVRWLHPATNNDMHLIAICEQAQLDLQLTPEKPVVIQGQSGISRKGPLPGAASHYLSFTRIRTNGKMQWKAHDYSVEGLTWMDHEFFTSPDDKDLAGWDWFAIQLDTREELMLYRIRRTNGDTSFSSGTYVDAAGHSRHLDASDFRLHPGTNWTSRKTGAHYPVAWHISVPALQLELDEHTALNNQELDSTSDVTPSYWEGAVSYSGALRGAPVSGVGYLELTGYARPVKLTSRVPDQPGK